MFWHTPTWSEQMNAAGFNLSKDMEFSFETGATRFNGIRLVVFDAGVTGLFGQKFVMKSGIKKTRGAHLRLGYQRGFPDFLQLNWKEA
jgi:hypothetical protein